MAYVTTTWASEKDEAQVIQFDGNGSEFGLDALIKAGDFPAEEVKKCILAEFPKGGDDEQPEFTILKGVVIVDENDEVLAEIEY